jgi:putative hydrolase of the HAD superfamily
VSITGACVFDGSWGSGTALFAALLGTEPDGLVEGLFAGLRPDQPMLEAVGRARDAGVPTGLISNSWVMDHYTDEIRSLFDEVVTDYERRRMFERG